MTLDELLQTCARSTRDDWNVITCWGGGGPSYLGEVIESTPEEHVREETHSMRAAYKPDLSIGFSWGYPQLQSWHEPWVETFADPHASSAFVDFFYNGLLVEREVYVVVDGGRAYIPLPTHELTITQWQYDFFRLLDGMERVSQFDSYVRRAGISVERP